jgi:hypothetical protein
MHAMNGTSLPNFPASDRFTILRRIGAGGMGIVYEAYDRERNPSVKQTRRLRADGFGIATSLPQPSRQCKCFLAAVRSVK